MEPISSKLIEVAASNGFVALLLVAVLLFCYWLVRYVLQVNMERETRYIEREERYIKIIDTLTQDMQANLVGIKGDINDLKDDIKHIFRRGVCD